MIQNRNQAFIDLISQELKKPLPGLDSQRKMLPVTRLKQKFGIPEMSKEGAVLLLLYHKNDRLSICFIKRSNDGGVHGGQISLPGGKKEASDTDLIITALRETEEEIGAKATNISILGLLSSLYIPVSNYSVTPVVGYCPAEPEFKINKTEVDELLEAPLNEMLNPANCLSGEIEVRGNFFEVPYFKLGKNKIWGATAMILSEFIQIIENSNKQIEPKC
jgi:8-oxo-dGTP pyrophosphatase MutT (NUDIX family)